MMCAQDAEDLVPSQVRKLENACRASKLASATFTPKRQTTMNPATTPLRVALRGQALSGKCSTLLYQRKPRLRTETGRQRSEGRPIGGGRQKSARKAIGRSELSSASATACFMAAVGTSLMCTALGTVRSAGRGDTELSCPRIELTSQPSARFRRRCPGSRTRRSEDTPPRGRRDSRRTGTRWPSSRLARGREVSSGRATSGNVWLTSVSFLLRSPTAAPGILLERLGGSSPAAQWYKLTRQTPSCRCTSRPRRPRLPRSRRRRIRRRPLFRR